MHCSRCLVVIGRLPLRCWRHLQKSYRPISLTAEQALNQQDTEALRRIAHRIKGTSANLQATMLSAAARELEQACSETTEGVRVIKHRVMLDQAQSVRDAIEAWSMAG